MGTGHEGRGAQRRAAGACAVAPSAPGSVGQYLKDAQTYLRVDFGMRQTLIRWDAELKRALA